MPSLPTASYSGPASPSAIGVDNVAAPDGTDIATTVASAATIPAITFEQPRIAPPPSDPPSAAGHRE